MASRKTRSLALGSGLLALAACGAGPRDEMLAEPEVAFGSTGGATDDGALGTDLDKLDLGAGSSDDGVGFGHEDECASFSADATIEKRPADIIFVVDNSPSMVDEADAVQARLNDFSQQIVEAGIDIRVLLLTAYPNPAVAESIDTGICIDPPLGGGGCPQADDNQPLFAHLHENIGSSHALQKILDTQAIWKSMMRESSTKHVIVVSDDDSYLSASDFDAQFRAFDPSYADYALHGIVSTSACFFADSIGTQYIELAQMTGGTIGDLCDQEFQPLFDLLSTAVLEGTSLACEWTLPEAPEGSQIDLETVEVRLEIDGAPVDAVRLGSIDECASTPHGWYYDDATGDTQLVACPQTCDALQGAGDASLQIDVGCASPAVG